VVLESSLRRVARAVLLAAMAIDAVAMWTVVPLGWLWIGSQIQGSLEPSLRSYGAVVVGVLATMAAMAWLLQRLNRMYEHINGQASAGNHRHDPPVWLRSMRGERSVERQWTVADRVMIASVLLAVCGDAVWFFFFAHLTLPGGR
jgi:hypothetical protein